MATWQDGPEYAPVERPYGFAEPDADPLPESMPPPPLPASPNGGPPCGMQEPQNSLPLAKLEPAQREIRDPKVPFAVAESVMNSALVQPPEQSDLKSPEPSAWGAVHRAPNFPPPGQMPPQAPGNQLHQAPLQPGPMQRAQTWPPAPGGQQTTPHARPTPSGPGHGTYQRRPGPNPSGANYPQPPISQYPPGQGQLRTSDTGQNKTLIVAMGAFGLGILLIPLSFTLLLIGAATLHASSLVRHPKLINTVRGFFGLALGTWLMTSLLPEAWAEIVFALTRLTDAELAHQILCVMCCVGCLLLSAIGMRQEKQSTRR